MEKGRIVALDIGSKRTGLAVCDHERRISVPLTKIEATQKKEWIRLVAQIVEEEEPTEILVGLPLNHHGEEGEDARKIREYIALLRERFTLPVIEWDERFTTAQAERTLITADLSRKKRRDVIDKVAASIILQSYLDSLRFQEAPVWEDD
jgi:putative holliday junction resolvase